jgi:hypothetical protein
MNIINFPREDMLQVIDQLRDDVVSGKVVAFGGIGISNEDRVTQYTGALGRVTRLRLQGALWALLHTFTHDDT